MPIAFNGRSYGLGSLLALIVLLFDRSRVDAPSRVGIDCGTRACAPFVSG